MGDLLTFAPRPRPAPPPAPEILTDAALRVRIEAAAEVAIDTAERLIALLDRMDGCTDDEDGGDAEPSLAAPEDHESQTSWCRGGDEDREAGAGEAALPEVAVARTPVTAADLSPLPILRWRGAGNAIAAAGVTLLDLVDWRA